MTPQSDLDEDKPPSMTVLNTNVNTSPRNNCKVSLAIPPETSSPLYTQPVVQPLSIHSHFSKPPTPLILSEIDNLHPHPHPSPTSHLPSENHTANPSFFSQLHLTRPGYLLVCPASSRKLHPIHHPRRGQCRTCSRPLPFAFINPPPTFPKPHIEVPPSPNPSRCF